jgi:hypothetical protein
MVFGARFSIYKKASVKQQIILHYSPLWNFWYRSEFHFFFANYSNFSAV